jgi:DNA processing protein
LIALNACLDVRRDTICRVGLAISKSRTSAVGPQEDRAGRRPSRADLGKIAAALRDAPAIAARELDAAKRAGATIVTMVDSAYPTCLRDLELPPPVLYLRGNLPERPAIAIVGSRKADPYGLEAARLFGRDLAAAGLTVVSGLARGIDSAAHRGALDTPAGQTVAAQACGIDSVYPSRHTRLAARIAANGCVLSEFPIGATPVPRNFPIRNRLIAGLSLGTLVIQAARRSGSLITARLALELGRDVYAVPGTIFHQRARGANELLRDGAFLALEPRDILDTLPIAVTDRLQAGNAIAPPSLLSEAAKHLLTSLDEAIAMEPEEISRRTGMPIEAVFSTLLELELAGLVHRYPGAMFHRTAKMTG